MQNLHFKLSFCLIVQGFQTKLIDSLTLKYIFEPAHTKSVIIAFTLSHSLDLCALPFNWTVEMSCFWCLLPYFVYMNSKGSGETAHMRSLA